MVDRTPLLYGIVGACIGGILVWMIMASAINTRQYDMTRMMGIKSSVISDDSSMMGNIDQTFIEQMIPHHQAAIDMATVALKKAEHEEIKTLAQNIKTSQSEEIKQMQQWYQTWFGETVPKDETTSSMMGMMSGNMMGIQTDTSTLENSQNFDKTFIEEMIPHHEMAVMMAQMLIRTTTRPEMKKLGEDIITAQTKEINEMQQWYKDWGYNQ